VPITRFSVSLDSLLVKRFDEKRKAEKCPTRSKAIGDLIRESLVKDEWIDGDEVAGAIILVYDHHKRDLVGKLTDLQHDYHDSIISTQHIHLDHDNCMEIIAVKGKAVHINNIASALKAVKGLKHCSLAATTTGKKLA